MSRESDELGREQHYEQFAPDLTSEPSLTISDEELKEINDHLARKMHEPIDLTETPF